MVLILYGSLDYIPIGKEVKKTGIQRTDYIPHGTYIRW